MHIIIFQKGNDNFEIAQNMLILKEYSVILKTFFYDLN